jgi:hypothetical protein
MRSPGTNLTGSMDMGYPSLITEQEEGIIFLKLSINASDLEVYI